MPTNPVDYRALNDRLAIRLSKYEKEIQALLDKAAKDLALLTALANHKPDKAFTFDSNLAIKKKVEEILSTLADDITVRIQYNQRSEWIESNKGNDKLVQSLLSSTVFSESQLRTYMSHNLSALARFQGRKQKGLRLSGRVWNLVNGQFKFEMENAIDMALLDGRGAAELSRNIRHLLNEPDKLFRRVRNERGILHLSKRAKAYNQQTGLPVGAYRSSYKNAMRVARTEITMAFRMAEHTRWSKLDFVVGFEVKLSNRHVVPDICDELKGKYPKEFIFRAWHPQCLCYVTSILATDEEFKAGGDAIAKGEAGNILNSKNEIKDIPDGFKKWITNNTERSKGWANQPYFIQDNFVEGKLTKGLKIKVK